MVLVEMTCQENGNDVSGMSVNSFVELETLIPVLWCTRGLEEI